MAQADPYDDLVMDHIKHARNYRVLPDANHQASGSNPLCGDELVIYLRTKRDRITDITFQCTCCGVSMASASIMSEQIKGKSTAEARSLVGGFVAILQGSANASAYHPTEGQNALLKTVQALPSRAGCAALPWMTLNSALDDRSQTVLVHQPAAQDPDTGRPES
jgi:nitrogen fixation NifU-like protein